MAKRVFTVDASGLRNLVRKVDSGAKVIAKPFAETRGAAAVKIMRTGTKGVERQFVDTTEYRLKSSSKWAKTKPFGDRKAGKTMLGTGAYKASWLGGFDGIEKITPQSVEIGVQKERHPQVAIHQGSRAVVTIRPTLKMRFFLGFTYGVWLTKETMKSGLKIARRRISISSEVKSEVAQMVRRETLGAIKGLKLSTGGSR